MKASRQRTAILVLFFFSGISYLIFEITWVRQATLTFGVSVFAYSAVLTAYMGGMALGGFLIRKWADKVANPLRTFAYLQLGLAVLGFLATYLLGLTSIVYASLAKNLPDIPIILMILRLGLAIIPLSIPASLIGASFPLIARSYSLKEGRVGSDLGRLYALHTAGSVIGCLLTATVLLRVLGLRETVFLASMICLLAGIASHYLGNRKVELFSSTLPATRRRKIPARVPVENKTPDFDPHHANLVNAKHFIIGAYAITGFLSLAYEVVWARLISLYTVGAVYSFSIMLSIYLAGLALGSLAGSWVTRKWKASLGAFGVLQIGIGFLAIAGLFIFDRLANLALEDIFGHYSLGAEMAFEGLLSVITLLPVTILIGIIYPIVSSLYTNDQRQGLGNKVSLMNALNTSGSILGSFLAGFLIIPALGLQKSVIGLSVVNLGIGLLAIWLFDLKNYWSRAISIGLAVIFLLTIFFLPEPRYLGYWKDKENLLIFYKEGIEATVAVFNASGENPKFSTVNGRVEVPTDVLSMRAFYLLGHLPAIMKPDSHNALMLSFGNGIASGALSSHKIPQIEVVELAEEMVQAASTVYLKENRNVIDYPGIKVHIEDARNFLLQTDQQYDLITTDATHPSNSSSWALFTREFYDQIRKHLSTEGVFIQWVPLHSLSIKDYLAILRTFQSVFPNATLWYTGGQHTLLLATPEQLTKPMLTEKLRATRNHLETTVDLGTPDLISRYWIMNSAQLRQFVGEGKLISDSNAYFMPDNSETESLVNIIQKATIQANP